MTLKSPPFRVVAIICVFQFFRVRRLWLRHSGQRRQDAILRVSQGQRRAGDGPEAHRQGRSVDAKVQTGGVLRGDDAWPIRDYWTLIAVYGCYRSILLLPLQYRVLSRARHSAPRASAATRLALSSTLVALPEICSFRAETPIRVQRTVEGKMFKAQAAEFTLISTFRRLKSSHDCPPYPLFSCLSCAGPRDSRQRCVRTGGCQRVRRLVVVWPGV